MVGASPLAQADTTPPFNSGDLMIQFTETLLLYGDILLLCQTALNLLLQDVASIQQILQFPAFSGTQGQPAGTGGTHGAADVHAGGAAVLDETRPPPLIGLDIPLRHFTQIG